MRANSSASPGCLLAITALDNRGSIAVLEKIGMRFTKTLRLPAHSDDSRLFEIDLAR